MENGARVSTDQKVVLSDYGRTARPASGLSYEEAGIQYKPSSWRDILGQFKNDVSGATRAVGRAGRNIGQGALALPAMIGDAPATTFNAASSLAGSDMRAPRAFSDSLQALDSPYLQDRSAAERVSSDIQRALAGAATGIGIGSAMTNALSPVAQGVGNTLQAAPIMQGVSATTGATASGLTREHGGGPIAQLAAGIAGGIAPPLIAAGAPALVRQTLRGGAEGQSRMQQNIQNFSDAGTSPSVGQATQNRRTQALESYLSKAPGGAGKMSKAATAQAQEISAGLEGSASKLSPTSSAEQAGRAIQRGISGSGGFTEQFKAKQVELYDKLDDFIPKQDRIDVSSTKAALEKLNADIPGAPAISKLFKNAKIQGIETALKSDTEGISSMAANPNMERAFAGKKLSTEDSALLQDFLVDGKLPFEALKKLRTVVGDQMSDWTIASDVPRSKWKALYGALSEDLSSAAKSAGPQAQQAWKRANNYTSAGMDRLDALQGVLDRSGGPEAIYKAATSGTKEGATTLRAVMQSLPEDAQKQLAATMVRRLGIAKAGVQNELGDAFSTETFLTNWNLLSPEAKRAAFDRFGPSFSKSMDTVASVAANLRQGSQVFKNPSGTGQAAALGTTVGGAAMAMLTGHSGYAASLGGYITANNGAARLMTNPRFVNWLAHSTRAPISALPSLVNQLAQSGEPDLIEFSNQLRTNQEAAQKK